MADLEFRLVPNGHIHDLHPVVVMSGELVASVCVTCWEQDTAQAWIRQRQQRIDACAATGGHQRERVAIMTLGQAGRDYIEGACQHGCGG